MNHFLELISTIMFVIFLTFTITCIVTQLANMFVDFPITYVTTTGYIAFGSLLLSAICGRFATKSVSRKEIE